MDQFFQNLHELFNSGDPEVRSWFLIRHNYMPFILCSLYALFCTVIGPAIMKNRKPFVLRMPMIIFNFTVVSIYVVCLSIILWNMPYVTWEQFCKGDYVRKGEVTYTIIRTGWILYVLKYFEFLDTVFFVLRKKNNHISFLHVMHHTVVPILGWISLRTEKSGMQGILGLINSFVHVIMYSYYGLAAIGPEVRKYLWWKRYLTQLQIIQFCAGIIFVTVIAPLSGCTMVMTGYILDVIFAPLFLYLFYQFYKSTFKPTKGMSIENIGTLSINDAWKNENAKNIHKNGIAKGQYINGNAKDSYINGYAKDILSKGHTEEELPSNGVEKQNSQRNERLKGE